VRPPALPRRLLLALLPPADRAAIAGDLDEEFAARAGRDGARAARRWYWRETLASLGPAVRLRFRARRRERHSASSHERPLPQMLQDARYTVRGWRREPLFAATAIGTQALGIAVAAAVVSVAYAVLWKPLPYADPDGLLRILEGERSGQFSYADFLELRRSARGLTHVAGFSGGSLALTGHGGAPERVSTVQVTAGFFEALGVTPAHGRTFRDDESRREAPRVVMLTFGAWQRRFGGDPSLVGRAITLDERPHTVVGVLPAAFEFPLRGGADFWVPLRPSPAQEARGYWHWIDVVGRQAPGVTLAQVQRDLELVAHLRGAEDPKWHGSARYRTVPLRDAIVAPVRPALLILLGGAALLFAAACANVAGLVLARAAARGRELSVRAAIGAAPGRLARQLVVENALLTLAGSAIGLLAADALVRAAMRALPAQQRVAVLRAEQLGVVPEVAGLTIAMAIAVGAILGLLPVARRAAADVARALTLRGGSHSSARTRATLVAAEIALAMMLLTGAGLLARSVYRLSQVSPGFDPRGLLTFRVTLGGARYADAPAAQAARERLLTAFRELPGVAGVATIDQLPLTGAGNNGTLQMAGRPVGSEGPVVLVRVVSANYFETMGIPLGQGRAFTDRDRAGAPLAVVVNDLLASQLYGGAPLGERITFEFIAGRPMMEIVGVVGNEQFDSLDRGRSPVVYFPYDQSPAGNFSVVIRTDRPAATAADARRAAASIDPELPLSAMRTIEEIATASGAIFFRRAVLWMLGVFALAAIALAGVGVYGTLAYVVSQRTREIGIRVALGARRADVVRLVLRHGLSPAAAGCVVGIGGSLALGGFLRALLFGVEPGDPATLAAALVFLAAVAVAACLVPVARAARVDPAVTLRQD
jgi:predicted permease